MKKYIILLLAGAMLFSSVGTCTATESIELVAPIITPIPGEIFSVEKDMGLFLGDVWYPIMSDVQPLYTALGEPIALNVAPSCVFVGEDKEFAYEGLSIFTNPVGENDIMFELLITSNAYPTSRGICVGDKLDKLLAAYGERYYWEGETILTYSVSGIQGDYVSPCMMFEVVEDAIVSIDIYYPTNVTE